MKIYRHLKERKKFKISVLDVDSYTEVKFASSHDTVHYIMLSNQQVFGSGINFVYKHIQIIKNLTKLLVFTISVYSSSCNSLVFGLVFLGIPSCIGG